ncbi:MAG: hypothetical protein WCI19_07675 [Betaproteobacteria bacterium]|jgi:hypothetical protein|nr:hypothetical protein [Rhodocyclales bacterium]
MTENIPNQAIEADAPDLIREPRLWCNNGWTARVVKNEDDEGWAVEMILDGESEPALIGPWTMGRDKKNPKPLDAPAFNTLVKTAGEFRQRQVQQLHAALHQNITINAQSGRISITLDIVPDEDDPHALLTARDAADEELAQVRVASSFKLNKASANAWIDADFRKPG